MNRKKLRLILRWPRETRLYVKYRRSTMVEMRWFIDSLLLAARVRDVSGCIVECGTWKGGMSAAIAEQERELGRTSVLFDSFEGLPPAREIDGPAALAWQAAGDRALAYYDNCSASEADAHEAMRRSGAPYEIRRGWFSDTVPAWAAEGHPIALLRLDGDWYDSTIVCLEHLYPLVAEGGLVILDDYGTWDGCTRAVHDYLSKTGAAAFIHRSRHSVAYIRKPKAQAYLTHPALRPVGKPTAHVG